MSFADVWNKTLVYFGIAEEEDWDEILDLVEGVLPELFVIENENYLQLH